MLASARARIERELPGDALVLDVGGWADPLARADWVVDLFPYETRGLYGDGAGEGDPGSAPERFSADTWITRDACDREPLPFEDDHFDFVVCSHTLEDVRDPIGLGAELARVGKAGYVEVPSRLEEQAWGVAGPFVGWSHHRWLIDLHGETLEFVHKPSALQALPDAQIGADRYAQLTAEQKVLALFWEGSFACVERVIFDQAEHDAYLAEAPARLRALELPGATAAPRRLRRLLGRSG